MAARLFRKRFEDAEALFDSGDIAGCILAAQRNITNVLRRATEKNDTGSLTLLQDLREELDWLARQRDEYLQEHKAWMLEQEGEDDEDKTDSEADGIELDDSEEDAEMEAEGVKLGEGNALILLPIRGHQPVIEALAMGTVPVEEDKRDNEGREEVTAGDEEGEEWSTGKMLGGGEQASTGDDGQLPGTPGVNREDKRSAVLAGVEFLLECQSYIPEHMQACLPQLPQLNGFRYYKDDVLSYKP
ncbi:uncharacterized protein J4E88_003922 [Alternaria novae-zelandiae]|uniref:uncharacterized protein n=1 Tax=Alternaria novae-zelandiae TaxID=430562 RepID=UPI0020C34802|nr:uncharacterized protein J4E88_003922 [Alternaria novae-zelandiae]KAI4686085.1 hypothetical protein J4E88_003922 [Alternaria novae-zelandiae]